MNRKRNGKRKEYPFSKYNEEKVIFEGEYLNGEMIGKGKEYYEDGELHFEYEYKNGKILYWIEYNIKKEIINEFKKGNGYLKEYYENGNLKLEGEYLNYKRNGIFKEYDKTGKLLYVKEYISGKIWNVKKYDKINNNIDKLKD